MQCCVQGRNTGEREPCCSQAMGELCRRARARQTLDGFVTQTHQHQGLNIAAQGCSEWKLCLCTPLGRKSPSLTLSAGLSSTTAAVRAVLCPEAVLVPAYSDGIKTAPRQTAMDCTATAASPRFHFCSVVVSSQQGTGQ